MVHLRYMNAVWPYLSRFAQCGSSLTRHSCKQTAQLTGIFMKPRFNTHTNSVFYYIPADNSHGWPQTLSMLKNYILVLWTPEVKSNLHLNLVFCYNYQLHIAVSHHESITSVLNSVCHTHVRLHLKTPFECYACD